MVDDPNDENSRQDERVSKTPVKPVDPKDDVNAIYNTPYHLPMTGLEKIEIYPY